LRIEPVHIFGIAAPRHALVVRAPVGNRNVPAIARQAQRHGTTDAPLTAGPRYQCDRSRRIQAHRVKHTALATLRTMSQPAALRQRWQLVFVMAEKPPI
jgi:hypothetical protein